MRLATGVEPLTQPSPDGRGLYVALAAALLCAASLAIRWPGVVMYDSVSQYEQALAGEYSDWHPPIMARAWALLNHLHAGTQPFFLLQMLLWWGGLGLIGAGLARRRRGIAAACVLAIGAAPLFLGWTTTILKDAQMACCLVGATGLVAHWRLRERPLPWPAGAAALALIGYATLVRGNAVFATVPLALALFGWGGLRRTPARAALVVLLTLGVIAAGPFVNHRLFGAEASHVERTLPLYDMAGIAHMARLATIPGLAPAEWRRAEAAGCYSPYFWNPYGEPAQCDFVGQAAAFGDAAPPRLMRVWAGQVARHPFAYAMHRAAHLNSNLRFWVGAGEGDAAPQVASEPNTLGLGAAPGAGGKALIAATRWMAASPLGWPCAWLAVALVLLWSARGASGQVALGRALALSAACMSGSFAVVSIASDLRYHLWSMVAAALAAILILDAGELDRRRSAVGGGAVLAVVLAACLARAVAPPVYAPLPARVPPPPAARA